LIRQVLFVSQVTRQPPPAQSILQLAPRSQSNEQPPDGQA